MSHPDDTWQRIAEANRAAGVDVDWSVAERDQMEALADDLNRQLERHPVLHAWRTKNGSGLQFWCSFCKDHHFHGRHGREGLADDRGPRTSSVLSPRLWKRYLQRLRHCQYDLWPSGRRHATCTCPAGSADGHRVAHCWNRNGTWYNQGYILHEVEPNDARALHRPKRGCQSPLPDR